MVVIKKLLQSQAGDHKDIIVHMAKLVDTIKVAEARAAILWVIGEYSERIPKIAPDVLRKMAKTFINEEVRVKLQILNLATKLCLVNPKQTKLLAQYVLSLAKYDQNYDVRDQVIFRKPVLTAPNSTYVLIVDSSLISFMALMSVIKWRFLMRSPNRMYCLCSTDDIYHQ